MPSWKRLLPLILLSLTVTLRAYAQSLEPSPRPTAKPSESASLAQDHSEQQPAPIGATNLPNASNGAGTSDTKEDDGSNASPVVIVIAIATVVSALATALIAWFNWQLVGVTDEMKKATSEAAEAARHSARAADLALNAEHPYVFVENQKVGMYLRISLSLGSPIPSAPTPDVSADPLKYKGTDRADAADMRLDFNLRNRGKGVAIIRSVRIRMLVGRGVFVNETFRLTTIGRSDGTIRGGVSLMGPSESAECSATGLSLPLDMLAEITEWNLSLSFAILVSYTDVYRRSFLRTFPFEYRGPGKLAVGDIPITIGPYLAPAFKKRRRRYR